MSGIAGVLKEDCFPPVSESRFTEASDVIKHGNWESASMGKLSINGVFSSTLFDYGSKSLQQSSNPICPHPPWHLFTKAPSAIPANNSGNETWQWKHSPFSSMIFPALNLHFWGGTAAQACPSCHEVKGSSWRISPGRQHLVVPIFSRLEAVSCIQCHMESAQDRSVSAVSGSSHPARNGHLMGHHPLRYQIS